MAAMLLVDRGEVEIEGPVRRFFKNPGGWWWCVVTGVAVEVLRSGWILDIIWR